MHLDPVWDLFETALFSSPSSDSLFNLYRDVDDTLDRPDAVSIRRANLRNYLARYEEPPRIFLLAEAPGPRGCRFSGVPFTSEAQLLDDTFPICGRQSSLREKPHAEYSGGIYWRVLKPFFPRFFTWNTVPFHPHKPGEPLSIRNPSQREVMLFVDVLAELLRMLQPEQCLAIGRKAEYAFRKLGVACTYIRHPSQGGAGHFESGIRALWKDQGVPG